MISEDYIKTKIAIRYWLLGQGYFKAVEAMNAAEVYHNGERKDGSPEFSHQISQTNLAKTLIKNIDKKLREAVFITIFYHDIPEDKDLSYEEIYAQYGPLAGDAIKCMTKVYRGVKVDNTLYYDNMSKSIIASFCKGLDRVHNLMSMLHGFKPEKRISYIKETMDFTIPMLKRAKRNFPSQESAYENIKFIMLNQIQLYLALDIEIKKNIS
jgi:(p)ppGpp synthase/HD superfamily hydrolase